MTSNVRGARNRSTNAPVIDMSWKNLEVWKTPMDQVKDCQECIKKGRKPYPISPAIGYCRRCKLDR